MTAAFDEFILSLPPEIRVAASAKLQECIRKDMGDKIQEMMNVIRAHAAAVDQSATRVAGEMENRLLNMDIGPLLQQMEGVAKTTSDNIFTAGSLTGEVGAAIAQFAQFRRELGRKSLAVSRSWWWLSLVGSVAACAFLTVYLTEIRYKAIYAADRFNDQQELYTHTQTLDAEYSKRYEEIAKAALGNQRAFLGLSEAKIHLGLEEYGGRTFVTIPGHVKVWYNEQGGMIELADTSGDQSDSSTEQRTLDKLGK